MYMLAAKELISLFHYYYYYYYCDIYLCSGIVQQVQFNLQLSEEERNERAKVVLPFEHQGMRTLNRDRN